MKKKNYYDLTSEELKKYNNEFKKTPGGYRIYFLRTFFQSMLFFFCIIYFIGTLFAVDNQELWVVILLLFLCTLLFLLNFIPVYYYNCNFRKWLKEKYNI